MENKKISGEDILLAVGEINERLLEVPGARRCRAAKIGKLTSVAALLVSFAVLFNFYYNLVIRGANAADPDADSGITSNDGVDGELSSGGKDEGADNNVGADDGTSEDGDSEGSAGNDEEFAYPEYIMLDYRGCAINMEDGESLVRTTSGGGVLIKLERSGNDSAYHDVRVFIGDEEITDGAAVRLTADKSFISIETDTVYEKLVIASGEWDFEVVLEFTDLGDLIEFRLSKD